ncbi:xylulokinase [Phyllobacterium sp. 0TCS1.6C]|uniref:xylulokinase n=1 Tax=unclassified Phyllobacterium TaxID=2638441 RepID=UPI002265156C|nr:MULTISPECIES: xylulokinase [unclassified Phyllobacterium]MCX8278975.1 xylulokinase [Phyllobacterium sp. 0TCS1.6C]MCX8293759.1 xylulokinase [Phyllobacterium sp. 0TCS1.6A]
MTIALLGIDIGTSGCKALLLSVDGDVLATGTATYGLSQPRAGWTEQDPSLWVEGTRKAVAEVMDQRRDVKLASIGLSGQMHGLTPLDKDKKVLRPAILWNDQRNAAEAAEITRKAGGIEALIGRTGNRMLVGYTGGKIVWMSRHEPELFARLRHVLNPKDYLRFMLTGELATEVSDASGTGLFDVKNRVWATDLIEMLGIDPSLLPICHESHEISGQVSASGAALFGLPAGIPVVGGGGDSVIQTIGSGVIAPGDLQTTIGTAGILAAALDAPSPSPDGRIQMFCNVAPSKWHAMGVSLNAGGAMGWFRSVLAQAGRGDELSFEAICDAASESPAGARGLLFLPYLNGERCPHPDPVARGAFVGLTARHTLGDMGRSVMEGVVHAFYDMHALMKLMGIEGKVIKASGGGAKSRLWRQIQADMFDCDVVTTEGAAEGAAFGAALVAGVGIAAWKDATEAAGTIRALTRERANDSARDVYRKGHRIYSDLYPALRASFSALADPAFAD